MVRRLLDAGALYVGKTNLDQFATGLNGTRTPYTVPRSVYGGDMISGGSSSGSALAVALGQVPFAVATDTAGSGRVPAALNGVVGFKPSRGLISTVGLVPACKSLDCISVMAGSIDDVDRVFDVMVGPRRRRCLVARPRTALRRRSDPGRTAARRRAGVLRRRARCAARTWPSASTWPRIATVVDVSLEPFLAAGALLYQGPWVAERLVEFGDFLAAQPDSIHPVVRDILRGGQRYTAVDAFAALQRLAELKAVGRHGCGSTWTCSWCRPSAPPSPSTRCWRAPIDCNTMLGHYTHFGNLLDLLGVAIPSGAPPTAGPTARCCSARH